MSSLGLRLFSCKTHIHCLSNDHTEWIYFRRNTYVQNFNGGGTCFAVGSHETVAEKIRGEGAVTQDALNRWAIAEGRAGLADGRWKLDYEGRGAVRVEQVYHRRDLEHTFFQIHSSEI